MDYSRGYVEPSKLPGNPFATEDVLYTEDANNSSVVNATLALAYEQRTATLLALWQNPTTETPYAALGLTDARLMWLQQEILKRLGFDA